MMLLRRIIYTVALVALVTATYGQDTLHLEERIAVPAPVSPGDSFIPPLAAPPGYRLVLKGSDHLPVVDSMGRITSPLTDTKVQLYFQLFSMPSDTPVCDISRSVVVPGKYKKNEGNPPPFVIPSLQEWHGGSGYFILRANSKIVVDRSEQEALQPLQMQLQKEIKEQTGYSLKAWLGKPGPEDIYLTLKEEDHAIGEEGYYLIVDKGISIRAMDYRGLFYGTRTLLQLLEHGKAIPKGIARDYPAFRIRGFVLDVARKFFTMQFLRNYVKLLSYYKMNDFQLHLSDNGFNHYFGNNWDSTYAAFRLENETYPGLTAKDDFYTKHNFRALEKLGDQYAVRIVPEIDVPAHSLAITKAVPSIGSKKYGMDHLDLHNPLTDTVVENIFKEYLSGPDPVFTGKVVDIGTDEYAKEDAEAFRAFTDRIIKYVQSYGKKVRLWGALTWAEGSTPVTVKGVAMNAWYNGYADPVKMKKLGYPLISTPDGWLYIVPAAGYYYDYLNLKNIYDKWTPSLIGNKVFYPGDPAVVGGSFAVWNDIVGNGISEKDVNDRVFPALQVLAQKMWSGADTPEPYDSFARHSQATEESPGLNIRGKLPGDAQSLVADFHFDHKEKNIQTEHASYVEGLKGKALAFTGRNSYALLPYQEIGYDYTVSFWVNPAAGNADDAPLFQSPDATVKLKQGNTGKLGFSRDGYDFTFNYEVPAATWTHIVISGTNKGTTLYVNGKLQDSLYNRWIQFDDKDKTRKRRVETLFFPLQKAGGFKGRIDELEIWNDAGEHL